MFTASYGERIRRPPQGGDLFSAVQQTLPSWARSLFDVAAQLAELPSNSSRRLTILTLPCRDFAGTYALLGAALRSPVPPRSTADFIPGSRVLYLKKNLTEWDRGVVFGWDTDHGQRALKVRISERDTYLLKDDDLERLLHDEERVLSLQVPSALRELVRRFGSGQAAGLLLRQKAATIACGTKKELIGEAESLTVALEGITYSAIDLLLPACLHGPSYLTDIVSGRRGEDDQPTCPAASIVVFDGAGAYLTRRHWWPRAHHLVLLDRSDPDINKNLAVLHEVAKVAEQADPVCDFSTAHPAIEGVAYQI